MCAPSFTPQSFWESIETRDVTWYYAAPTMHAQIVLHVENLGFVPQNKVRYVANAAGGLPPHLAIQLMNTFQCPILPSYGMTVTHTHTQIFFQIIIVLKVKSKILNSYTGTCFWSQIAP